MNDRQYQEYLIKCARICNISVEELKNKLNQLQNIDSKNVILAAMQKCEENRKLSVKTMNEQSKNELKSSLIHLIYLASKELVIIDDPNYDELSLTLKVIVKSLSKKWDQQ